jgi:hypothetical protein
VTSLRDQAIQAYGGKEPIRMKAAITLATGIKRCGICREWLPTDRFGQDLQRGDGLNNKCRSCVDSYQIIWHERPENQGKQAAYARKSRYGTEAARARTAENRLRQRCTAYGITLDDYRGMLARQNGGCAICGRTAEQNGKALAIDHDHRCCPQPLRSCGRCVRGLLCSPCNVAVGYFESEATMRACRDYVQIRGANPAQ